MKTIMLRWAKIGGISMALALVLTGCSLADLKSSKAKILKPEEAKAKAETYINENLMQGRKATVESIIEENGLYKLSVDLGEGQKVDSYITKDGTTFFPQALSVEGAQAAADNTGNEDAASQPPAADIAKSDKPAVELFVMSHCPYGTQIEKGIIPVVEKLGNKIDFKLKFCDYAMHGEKELKEELNQYCIDKNEPTKLLTYLKCFLKEGNGEACLTETGIDKAKLSSCASETDQQFEVMKKFNAKTDFKGSYPSFGVYAADNAKYGVGGSPTLIVNGTEAQSGRSQADLMATICAGFNNAPDECKEKLSSESPAPGFGEGTVAGNSADAGCAE
ncbi:MAG: hypothetical protein WC745_01870 [Patescibacteria group bacterium]|jgi:hypothetical protein